MMAKTYDIPTKNTGEEHYTNHCYCLLANDWLIVFRLLSAIISHTSMFYASKPDANILFVMNFNYPNGHNALLRNFSVNLSDHNYSFPANHAINWKYPVHENIQLCMIYGNWQKQNEK